MLLDNKRVLITGGTGSLGQSLVRRLLTGELGQAASITVFSRDEAKQHYMRLKYMHRTAATDEIIYENSQQLLKFRIGDIRDYPSVVQAVKQADVVFHTAALKQVPICEYYPFEAVQTNVVGPQNLVRAIKENTTSVEAVIGISTDKACKPVNVMGMTKALQERVLIQANLECPDTRFMCVRYGNVISSRGSVIPLFLDQLNKDLDITITHEQMTRFLISLDSAVDTVFSALRLGNRGETFVPTVPAAKVVDIAETLAQSQGKSMTVKFTGVRPGEKLHEILVSEEERHRTTERGGYYVICPVVPELREAEIGNPPLTGEYSSENVTLTQETLSALLAPHISGITNDHQLPDLSS